MVGEGQQHSIVSQVRRLEELQELAEAIVDVLPKRTVPGPPDSNLGLVEPLVVAEVPIETVSLIEDPFLAHVWFVVANTVPTQCPTRYPCYLVPWSRQRWRRVVFERSRTIVREVDETALLNPQTA